MRMVGLLVMFMSGAVFAETKMSTYSIDVPMADPVTITYPASWAVSNITTKAPPGKIAPPSIMFTSKADKEFWIRIVFMVAQYTRLTSPEEVDFAIRQAAVAGLEGNVPPDLKINRFRTKEGYGSYTEVKDPKWDGKDHKPGHLCGAPHK